MAQTKENKAIIELIHSAQAYDPRLVAITFAVDCPANAARFATPLEEHP